MHVLPVSIAFPLGDSLSDVDLALKSVHAKGAMKYNSTQSAKNLQFRQWIIREEKGPVEKDIHGCAFTLPLDYFVQ